MKRFSLLLICIFCLLFSGCGAELSESEQSQATQENIVEADGTVEPSDVPEYSGEPYVVVNANMASFTEEEMTTDVFEQYDPLDQFGRCGEAYANICEELMPTEKRESISSVKPTGWQSVEYDIVDGDYLYNRCHLIGFQLAGENANENNLITGTRYCNVEGMLPFENMIAEYVKDTGNHVLYKVTPIFEGANLVASGVQMEAKSVEDNGEGVEFNVYCYNVQPGIEIDYETGESWLSNEEPQTEEQSASEKGTFILNTNSMKFHKDSCSGTKTMKKSNKEEFAGSREELLSQGYEPCKNCNP
ncbi:MAG: DNA/RNA non-specific endonuclease [Schaedlerella sp.]|nr:DNA/RNA non-specific endonuclease [Schaedlerella sp.]